MKRFLFLVLSLISLFTELKSQALNEKEISFLQEASFAGQLQIRLAEMAKMYAITPEVKTLADNLIADHKKALEDMKKLASSKMLSLPEGLNKPSQSKLDKLASKKGKDFDKAYTSLVMQEHKAQGDKFEAMFTKGNDAALKAWALKRWPELAADELAGEVAQNKIK